MNAKISVSLPKTLYRRLEASRKARGLGRSAAVQRALRAWTSEPHGHAGGVDWEYIEAYRKQPQDPRDAVAWEIAQADAWGPPWPQSAAKRARKR